MKLVWVLFAPKDKKPEGYKSFRWYAEGFDSESGVLRAAVYAKYPWQMPFRMVKAEAEVAKF